jgi:hypothetical protein
VNKQKVKLNKWYLFLTQLLNVWNGVIAFTKKSWVHALMLAITFFIFAAAGYFAKYGEIKAELAWQHQFQIKQAELQKQNTERKVKAIMQMYNCKDFVILEAIMETKYPVTLACLIAQESEFNPLAVSHADARGLCQIMSYHFKRGDDWKNPTTSIRIADKLLSEYMEYFKDDPDQVSLALASYNAGFPLVKKIGRVPDIDETQHYVKRINNNLQKVDML